jgi:hypothetical protein
VDVALGRGRYYQRPNASLYGAASVSIRLIWERQRLGIGLIPFDAFTIRAGVSCCVIKHRLVEVGCDNSCACRKPRGHRACQNAGSRGGLQHMRGANLVYSRGDIHRIRFEYQRDQISIVDFGDRSREKLVTCNHETSPVKLTPW